ncbi:MAG: TolC family protein [Saprospiraceae bacterium]|jgi:outer membrane protein|nr:TolC family protein [Saprospiraceae bacterium]MBL0023971.1 TolC family protein [Saprospiraceae bacterium]
MLQRLLTLEDDVGCKEELYAENNKMNTMNIIRIYFSISAILLTATFCAAQENKPALTLQNCLDIAIANNIQVKQSELREQADKLNYNQAKYNRLPNVSAGINYGINNGRSIDPFTNSYNNQQLTSSNANLTASVPVFKGFQTQNYIKQADLTYQATKMELQQEKDNITLNVILSFLQLMNDEDVLALTNKQLVITQKQVERLNVLNNEGSISPSLLYDLKGQYAADQLAYVSAAKSVELSKLALGRLMNLPYNRDLQINREGFDTTLTLYDATADNIYNNAIQSLAMVKAADLRTLAATKGIKVAAAGLYPTLSLFGQLGSNYSSAASTLTFIGNTEVVSNDYVVVNGSNIPVITKQSNFTDQKINFLNQYNNNLNTYAGISLRVPIFSNFQTRSNIKLARIEEKRNSYIAENTRVELRQAIDEAHLNTSTAWDRYNILTEQVAAFDESYRTAEIRFNLGAINSVEYLIVKNNLDRANINLTIARYEYLLRTKVLDFYQGRL